MKKLLAILLSMLLLCSMIPFASVSAAGDYTIELVADAEEVDAGDELVVEVSLYGHEDIGLICALLKLDFDHDVFELETYYDEDEETWIPPIEVGPKFNASSNKYIVWPQIDEETGYMEHCSVQFNRATASATQAVKTNLFYTVTFKVKDDAPSGTYTIDVRDHNDKNLVMYGNKWDSWTWEPLTITVNGSEPAHTCDFKGTVTKAPTCGVPGVMTYACECGEGTYTEEIPATGNHEYLTICDQYCLNCGLQSNPDAAHNVIHVVAKAPTCVENGNIEYWYCDACGQAWLDAECTLNTNLKAVILPVTDEHTYDDDYDVDCNLCGDIRVVQYVVTPFGGTSFQESNDGLSGLAFRFDITDKIQGLSLVDGTLYVADYSNATVTPDSASNYKLVTMGALISNNIQELDVPAKKVIMNEGDPYYAIRIIEIPEVRYDVTITCVPYYVYENNAGEQITVYGDAQAACVDDVLSN